MHRFSAAKQFLPDGGVDNSLVPQDRTGNSDCLLGIVSCFTEAPFALRIPNVAWNDLSAPTVKAANTLWIPIKDIAPSEILALFTDRIPSR